VRLQSGFAPSLLQSILALTQRISGSPSQWLAKPCLLQSPVVRMCHPRSRAAAHQRMLLPGTRTPCRSHIPLVFFHPAALCEKSSITSIHTTNKSQVTATPFSCPLFDVQHKMCAYSPSGSNAGSPRPVPGPPPSSDAQPQQPRAQHCVQHSCPVSVLPAPGSLLPSGLLQASFGTEACGQGLDKPNQEQQKHRGNPTTSGDLNLSGSPTSPSVYSSPTSSNTSSVCLQPPHGITYLQQLH